MTEAGPPGPDVLDELVRLGDLDELVREVDRRAGRQDWDGLLRLRASCEAATEEYGRQLWGAARYAEYRLALEAPGPIAASVVEPGTGRFTLGPLSEVVAQHHEFDELADGLDPIVAGAVAQERILRGEDLRDDPRAQLADTGLPGVLQPWEPRYVLPTYRAAERLDGTPAEIRRSTSVVDGPPGRPRPMPDVERALTTLVSAWTAESGGEAHVVVVDGDAPEAIAAVTAEHVGLVRLGVGEAFERMAWAAASGGAHGRRRGGAAGRAAAWWVGHAVTGLAFPADPDELEFQLEELCWYAAATGGRAVGWELRLAVAHPTQGWAAALDAVDRSGVDTDAPDEARGRAGMDPQVS